MVTRRTSSKALKVEDKQPRDYEMVLIISPEVEGEKLETTVDRVSQFITERGGVVAEVERWGKRRLAYPIKHFTEGDYVLARFNLKATASKELEANLQISEEVLRHLLISVES